MSRARRISRRRMLAGAVGFAGAAALGLRAVHAGNSLQLLTWDGFADEAVLGRFPAERDLQIRADLLTGNEQTFNLLRAKPYDLVTPWHGAVPPLASAGLLQPLDPSLLVGLDGLLPAFSGLDWATADGQLYAVPVLWSVATGLADPAHIAVPDRWLRLFEEPYRQSVLFPDDMISVIGTWNRVLGATDPARVPLSTLSDCTDALIALKQQAGAGFTLSRGDAADALKAAKVRIVLPSMAGLWLRSRLPNRALTPIHPAPGDLSVLVAAAIPADAPNPDDAYALINHLLMPETQAALAASMGQGVVVADAVGLLPRDDLGYAQLDLALLRSPLVGIPPLESAAGEATWLDWVEAWDRVRMAPYTTPTPTPAPTAAAAQS